ncbi:hypothetical protein PR202_ga23181 [Eleusine coracana subsp. coracana]|uniref:F-box protein n=1 Tax=Eleusine coracana subsp. coracana TaxID=191504 RepID=A0AAV5D4J5_ELECO|nr:hypothetical protein PR202_ga23181 [Eleusine coracana subsp. coracana]
MSAAGDPLDALPAAVLADILGRVADSGDIAASRLASRALLSASYLCPRVRIRAADLARRRREGGGGTLSFRASSGNVATLLGSRLRSLELDAADGQGSPDDAMWVEEGEFDEADDLHLTSREAVTAWAATDADPSFGRWRLLITGRRRAGERRRRSLLSLISVSSLLTAI